MLATIEKPPSDMQEKQDLSSATNKVPASDGKTLILGLLFGMAFGFLLQKGGVAKYHVLIGQLLLVDFTVLKVMLSAVVVGSLGVHFMHHRGLVKLHIKPTRLASNALGGLLFGCGFALSAYCPGTGAAALGQGNWDALAMVGGMIAGSYIFAEASGWISSKLDPLGNKGKLTLHDILPFGRPTVVLGSALLFTVILLSIEVLAVR